MGTTESETSLPRSGPECRLWGLRVGWQEIILEGFQPAALQGSGEPKVLDTCCHPGRQATGAHGSG